MSDLLPQLGTVANFHPDFIVMGVGGADSMVHPSRAVERLLGRFGPRSWRGVAGLEPRPYFSARRIRRERQRITSAAKIIVKRLAIGLTGGYQRLSAAEFESCLNALLGDSAIRTARVFLVGLQPIDERRFPRSEAKRVEFDAIVQALVAKHAHAVYVATEPVVSKWDHYLHDRCHLNEVGHKLVAEQLLAAIERLDTPSLRS